MNNEKILEKEIDLIQNCITRMGQNSFSVKGWLIALIIAIIALLSENVDIKFVCMIIIGLTGVFWILDAFYDLNPYKKEMWLLNEDGTSKKEPSIIRIMFTKTLWPFYLPIILIALAILVKCVVK